MPRVPTVRSSKSPPSLSYASMLESAPMCCVLLATKPSAAAACPKPSLPSTSWMRSYSDRTLKLTRDRADRFVEGKARDAGAAGGNGKSSNAAIGESDQRARSGSVYGCCSVARKPRRCPRRRRGGARTRRVRSRWSRATAAWVSSGRVGWPRSMRPGGWASGRAGGSVRTLPRRSRHPGVGSPSAHQGRRTPATRPRRRAPRQAPPRPIPRC